MKVVTSSTKETRRNWNETPVLQPGSDIKYDEEKGKTLDQMTYITGPVTK